MARKITTNDINLKEKMVVEGKTKFTRISAFIEGEELQRDIKNQEKYSKIGATITKPYNKIILKNVEIKSPASNKDIEKDEKGRTNGQIYLSQKLYKSKKNPKPEEGFLYQAVNKGKYLPRVFVKDKNTNTFNEIVLEGELAEGTPVKIVHNVYKGAMGNNGIGIAGIFILDPDFNYYSSNSDEILNDLGMNIVSLSPKELEEKRQKAKNKAKSAENKNEYEEYEENDDFYSEEDIDDEDDVFQAIENTMEDTKQGLSYDAQAYNIEDDPIRSDY